MSMKVDTSAGRLVADPVAKWRTRGFLIGAGGAAWRGSLADMPCAGVCVKVAGRATHSPAAAGGPGQNSAGIWWGGLRPDRILRLSVWPATGFAAQ